MAETGYEVSDMVAVSFVGDEAIILSFVSEQYMTLNSTAAIIWKALSAREPVDSIVRLIAQQYTRRPEEVADDVEQFIALLEELGLVAPCASQPTERVSTPL